MRLKVGREAVVKVLLGLDRHEIMGKDAQQWASFVQRGYFAVPGRGPVRPLQIEYESAYEDAIAEIISRLDSIGDVIDGDIPNKTEIAEYLALFAASAKADAVAGCLFELFFGESQGVSCISGVTPLTTSEGGHLIRALTRIASWFLLGPRVNVRIRPPAAFVHSPDDRAHRTLWEERPVAGSADG